MENFPKDYELIQFFESEPLLKDAGVPWCYNHLTFVTVRDTDHVEFEIQPGYGSAQLRWSRNQIDLINLCLEEIDSIKVEITTVKEVLHLLFKEGAGLRDLMIQLKPNVYVSSIRDNDLE